MPRRSWLVCVALLATVAGLPRAQERSVEPPTSGTDDWPTFRAGVRLATIDAVVVDRDGRHVTDLKPADFEIVERGRSQAVRQALYVQVVGPDGRPVLQPTGGGTPTPGPSTSVTEAAPRPRPIAAASGLASTERTSRVLAIVVDDLGLSFESAPYVRKALTDYVDTKVAPGDLVAIIRTGGAVGTLQQFTTDRRLLHAAIDGVRWSFQSRKGIAAFDPVAGAGTQLLRNAGRDIDGLRAEVTTGGTLGALEYVLRGLESLPGRKSVVFVSEGFDLGIRDQKVSLAWSAFTRVMDRANRAGVVVYTMDARGLQTGLSTAEDGGDAGRARLRELLDSQESLVYLAQQTGGFAVLNTNDLAAGIGRVIDDTRGYYLLGFDTSMSPDERWDPNDIRIKIKRPGLTVRARRGLFGPADKQRPHATAPSDPLVAAAISPFAASAIDMRLTTLFVHDRTSGSCVRSLVFVDPAGVTFTDGADGRHEADLSVLLLAIGDNGEPIAEARLRVPLRLDDDAYARMRQQGLLYSTRIRIKAAGGYQIRAAVQDDRSKAIGTSAQFVEVPKVGKDLVAVSGVVMMDVAAAGPGTPGEPPPASAMLADVLADGVLGDPAIKIFKPGSEVVYAFEIYDGRTTRSDKFSTRVTLIRDGKAFYTTPPAPVSGAPADARPVGAVPVGGQLSLGRGLPRGTYTLQVSVAPQSSKGRDRQASQWVDFEVR
jgi:VWFA-related protein